MANPTGKPRPGISSTDPGATILAGMKPGLTRQDLFRAFTHQAYDEVMPRSSIHMGRHSVCSWRPDPYVRPCNAHLRSTAAIESRPVSDAAGSERQPRHMQVWDANIDATLDSAAWLERFPSI
jgi:hypothetical protein